MGAGLDVGFIGLGDMGGAMAVRIAKSDHRLHVWARSPQSLDQLQGLSVTVHSTPADLARAVEHLGICVTSEADVQAVLVDSGALEALPPDGLVALHATLAPRSAVRFAELAKQGGHRLIDAPVSGMREGAEAGQLLVLVGASADDLEAARPVLETYAADVRHVGDVGAGQTVKLLNNLVMNSNLATAHLVLQLGERLGIPRSDLRGYLMQGSATSRMLDVLDRTVIPGRWPAVNAHKDLAIIAGLLDGGERLDALLGQVVAMAGEVRADLGSGLVAGG